MLKAREENKAMESPNNKYKGIGEQGKTWEEV